MDRVGRSSLPYVINEGDAWVAAVDAALAHHALILRRLHGDPRCRRPSQRRASIKNFRESKPAFPTLPIRRKGFDTIQPSSRVA